MSNRLDQDREKRLQPQRIAAAIEAIQEAGHAVLKTSETTVVFMFRGEPIQYHAYSGWASGKTITDGRGLQKLLTQIKTK